VPPEPLNIAIFNRSAPCLKLTVVPAEGPERWWRRSARLLSLLTLNRIFLSPLKERRRPTEDDGQEGSFVRAIAPSRVHSLGVVFTAASCEPATATSA
jgi:hypothetical protein